MTTVYVVSGQLDYGRFDNPSAVFSTREKAEEFAGRLNRAIYTGVEITEKTVDESE